MSRTAIKAMGDEAFARRPVGTGPFKVKDWKSGESVELEAFAGAFSGAPKVQRVICPIIAEESSGMTAILGNQVDLTSTAPFADVPSLEKKSEVRVLKQAGLNTRYIALNNKKGPFADLYFRRAVSMAFDREVLVKAVLFGEGVGLGGVLPPALTGGATPTSDYVKFNPEKARAELARQALRPAPRRPFWSGAPTGGTGWARSFPARRTRSSAPRSSCRRWTSTPPIRAPRPATTTPW